MFTVYNKETKRSFKVFNVMMAPVNAHPIFLIFDEQWKWVEANEYVPEYTNLDFE